MAKQLKKFCRITKYIEKTDPKLYEILDDLCVIGAFRPRRDHNGTTFIWPSKETISALDKLRYTDDIGKGCDIVFAHIVHDYLPNAAAWNAKKGDIPNGSNRKLEVKAVTGNKVTLIDGAELEHDDKFKTFRPEGQTQAVWRVTKGSIDHTKYTKTSTGEFARKGAPQKTKVEAHGGRKNRWHVATGGSLMQHVMGGGFANAPFGHLVAFSKYLEEQGDNQLVNELRIVLSTEMITTCAFVTRKDSKLKDAFTSYRDSPEAKKASMYGQDEYLKVMDAGHKALTAKKSGGATATEFSDALSNAFKKSFADSETALSGTDLPQDFTPDTLTALNLSRAMEYACLKNIPKDEKLFKAEKIEEIKELVEVIEGRANGHKGLETDSTSSSMGQLIASVFIAVDKFNNGPYKKYPFESSSAFKDGKDQLKAIYGPDNSFASKLSKLTPDELSSLFSNFPSGEVEPEA